MEAVHRALVAQYPGLRFHVGGGGARRSKFGPRTSLVVEYDRQGVLSQGGNERTMRELVHRVLDETPAHTYETVSFIQYVDPREVEAKRRLEEVEGVLEGLKKLVDEGAPDDAIGKYLIRYKYEDKLIR